MALLRLGFAVALLLPLFTQAQAQAPDKSLDDWLRVETAIAQAKMAANISPVGAVRGIIIASPSRQDPDYYFHWIRDSSLVVDALISQPATGGPPPWLAEYADFIALSRQLQSTKTLTGLGEPRFNVDGTPYSGEWSRPQNDGPALRVLTVYHGVDALKTANFQEQISALVETDVQYILSHREQPCYDLWEEILGQHFYTHRVQLAALQAALRHFDHAWKFSEADLVNAIEDLRGKLEHYWQADKGYFAVTRDRVSGGEKYKFTDLDTAIILAALHSQARTGALSIEDKRFLSTATKLEAEFARVYAVNATPLPGLAPAIGRYTGDVYFGGNPWYITTAAFAEFHYKLAAGLAGKKSLRITKSNLPFLSKAFAVTKSGGVLALSAGAKIKGARLKMLRDGLIERGDEFMSRLRHHTPADGSMSEQYDRAKGTPLSARDLTWSYASFLTAAYARAQAKGSGH